MKRSRVVAQTNFSTLPEGVQAHILQLLPPAALQRARLTCKAWAQLVPGPALASKQHLTLGSPNADQGADLAAACQRCPAVVSLALRQPATSSALASLTTQLTQLTSLVCCVHSGADTRQLAALAGLSALRSLQVTYLAAARKDTSSELDLSSLTGLVSLRMAGLPAAALPASLASARGLTELDLESSDHFANPQAFAAAQRTDAILAAALPALTLLRSLRLAAAVGSAASLAQVSALTALTRLHLPDAHDGAWLLAALAQLGSLADVRVSARSFLRSLAFDTLSSRTALTRLDLTIDRLRPRLAPFLVRLPHLADLRLRTSELGERACVDMAHLSALTALSITAPEDRKLPVSAIQASLAPASQLRRLSLQAPRLAVGHMPCLPQLEELDLAQTTIDLKAGLPALAAQQPALRCLALRACRGQKLTAHLAACTALTELRLHCDCQLAVEPCCLDYADLSCLDGLPALAHLLLQEGSTRYHKPHPRLFVHNVARSRCLRRLTLCSVLAGDSECAVLAASRSLECVTFRQGPDPQRTPAHLCRPPPGSPGLAALLGSGCRVVFEDFALA